MMTDPYCERQKCRPRQGVWFLAV